MSTVSINRVFGAALCACLLLSSCKFQKDEPDQRIPGYVDIAVTVRDLTDGDVTSVCSRIVTLADNSRYSIAPDKTCFTITADETTENTVLEQVVNVYVVYASSDGNTYYDSKDVHVDVVEPNGYARYESVFVLGRYHSAD